MSKLRPNRRGHKLPSTPYKVTKDKTGTPLEGEVQCGSILTSQVGRLFLNKDMSDVTLLARGGKAMKGAYRKFPVHRQILANCSDYWRALLCGSFKEAHQSEIKIEDTSADTLEEVLRFVYCGSVHITPTNTVELLMAAKVFQLDVLKDTCLDYAWDNMTIDLCFSLLEAASTGLGLDDLKDVCIAFVLDNGNEVLNDFKLLGRMNK
eukprot:Ihof_evm1s1205 gene=Ihof_evmTU1s1205